MAHGGCLLTCARLVWALVVLTLYSSGFDPPALEVLIHLFQ